MKKHLISISICTIFISPIFIFFSKDYRLLVGIISGIWCCLNLFLIYFEKNFIKDYTDSYELAEDMTSGWIIEYVKASCQLLGINKPPNIRIDMNSSECVSIFGNPTKSTIIISADFLVNYHPETVQAVLAHELGHLYLGHTSIRSFLFLFKRVPREMGEILSFINEVIGMTIGKIPFVGPLIALASLTTYTVAMFFIWAFVMLVALIECPVSRILEYEADKFSYRLNFHEELLIFFHFTEANDERKFFNLDEHPKTSKRKSKLLKYLARFDEKYLNLDFDCLGESYDGLYREEEYVAS